MTGELGHNTVLSSLMMGYAISDYGPANIVLRLLVTMHTDGDKGTSCHCGHLTE